MTGSTSRSNSAAFWHETASNLSIEGRALIDGKLVEAMSGAQFDAISPIDGRVIASVAACDEADVNAAVASARRAFDDGRWKSKPPAERKAILQRFAELLRRHSDELASLVTLEMGKPISVSVAGDVSGTARCFGWYAESIDKIYDEIAPTGERDLAMIAREPLGVVAAVVPWNFPLVTAAWKCAPALAMGNSVVLKPAEQSPLSAIRLGQIALEAGIPEGVLNVVPGYGHTAGKALACHMDVDGIFFTGSTATGRLLMEYSAKSNLKKISLELGGKSPNIILSSYSDIEKAATTAANTMFANQGEVCIAPSRLIVERAVLDQVKEVIAACASDWQPSDPFDPETRMGPWSI